MHKGLSNYNYMFINNIFIYIHILEKRHYRVKTSNNGK